MKDLKIRYMNLDHIVYQRVKEMILNRELLPGAKIYQDKLATQLEVSRTPLMAALKKLEQEKLVNAIPRRGFFVREFTREEFVEIFEIREVMEGLAARKAAMNITEEQILVLKDFFKQFSLEQPIAIKEYSKEDRRFHNYLLQLASDMTFLSEMFESFNIITLSYQAMQMEGLFRLPEETLEEHFALIEKICEKDPQASEKLARAHLKASRENLIKEFQASKVLSPDFDQNRNQRV